MRKLCAFLLMLFLLSGCSNVNQESPGRPRTVNRITAVYQKGAMQLQREYTDDQKMRSVLDYLRLLKTYGPSATDPTLSDGSQIRLTVHFSDKTQRVYEQRDDAFLRCDGGAWEHINPEQGQELALLLGMLESD